MINHDWIASRWCGSIDERNANSLLLPNPTQNEKDFNLFSIISTTSFVFEQDSYEISTKELCLLSLDATNEPHGTQNDRAWML